MKFSDCTPQRFSSEAIVGAVERELEGVSMRQPIASASSDAGTRLELRLDVDCSSATHRIHASALNPSSGAGIDRDVTLTDVPVEDRPRVLALASGELLQTLGYQLDASSTAPAPTAAFPPAAEAPQPASGTAPPARPPARPPPASTNAVPRDTGPSEPALSTAATSRALEWLVAGKIRWFPQYGGVLFGAGLGLGLQRLAVGVEALAGSSEDTLGQASVGSAAATSGYDVVRIVSGAWVIRGAVAGALGFTWASGEEGRPSVEAFSTRALYMDARGTLSFAWGSLQAPRLLLGIEAGHAAGLIATADHQPVAATGGWFTGTMLGGSF